jgi:methyltransferase (TIGR00027 family)
MQAGSPSRTAINAARMRALHLIIDDEPKLLSDPLAGLFCDTEDARRVRQLWDAMIKPVMAGIRAVVVVRQRFAEDALAEAYARGVRQYVILGAGLDSFAHRCPPALGDLRVFELDHPATQAWKRARLAAHGIAAPPRLRYVPINFETQSLGAALAASEFDARAPAFLSWLSVLFYLTPEAVFETFRAIAAGCSAGSEIACDFLPDPATLDAASRARLEAMARRTAEQGEPVRTYLDPHELEGQLRGLGYDAVTHLSGAAAHARYLAGREDGLALPRSYGLLTARVGAAPA